MDAMKREMCKVVLGRIKCPCCNPFYYNKDNERIVRRVARRKIKHVDRNETFKDVEPYVE